MVRAGLVALVAGPWSVGTLGAALRASPAIDRPPIPRLDRAERSDRVNVRAEARPPAARVAPPEDGDVGGVGEGTAGSAA